MEAPEGKMPAGGPKPEPEIPPVVKAGRGEVPAIGKMPAAGTITV
jgi:hypothetical protein